jgi:cysteinyl-tRNA synthetase
MNDDLNVPQALAVLHNTRRAGNAALDSQDRTVLEQQARAVLAMTEVLGLNPLRWQGDSGSGGNSVTLTATVDTLVGLAIQQRQAARERKDYPAADAIRDELAAAGIQLEDTPNGPRWTLAAD